MQSQFIFFGGWHLSLSVVLVKSIHVVVCSCRWLFLIVLVSHVFIHSPGDGYLGCSQFGSVKVLRLRIFYVMSSGEQMEALFSGRFLGVELLSHRVTVCLAFKDTARQSFY